MQLVNIPIKRIKALIGENGDTKKEIQKRGDISLEVTNDGTVTIESEDPFAEWKAVDVVKAIGRGFLPETAFKLFKDEYVLKLINLKEIFPKEKARFRQKARIIGTKGKAKKEIEEISGAIICVSGNTVGIIGEINEAILAEKGINMILKGVGHGNVFSVLRKEKKRLGIG